MTLVLTLFALLFPSLAPVTAPRGCGEIVVGQMYACPDGHAYIHSPKGWQDIGSLQPEPVLVPTTPER